MRLPLILAWTLGLGLTLIGVDPPPIDATAAAVPVTKVLVVVEENHSLAQMQAQMPYAFELATQYGYATQYRAIRHPSLPNYLAIISGSTQGVTDDKPPADNPVAGPTVLGQTIAAGGTARTYAESMPTNCRLTPKSPYMVRHNPWAYFTDERGLCNQFDVPFTRFDADVATGSLPTVGLVVPNNCDNAHNCPLATADAWFQARMETVFAGPDWASGHLAVVLTADEDDRHAGNLVLTVVIHPSQDGRVVTTPLTHYSLTRLLCDVGHTATYLGAAGTAPSMSTAFNLPIG